MNTVASEAGEKAKEIENRVQEFFDRANDILSWVPDEFSQLVNPIQDGLQRTRKEIQDFWDQIGRLLVSEHGEPSTLKDVGDRWVNDVGNSVHDISGELSLDKLRTYLEWEGKAAEAYKTIVPAQVEGLKGIKSLAEQLQASLTKLGDAIESFWTTIIFALVGFLCAIGIAIAEALGVVTLPASIPTILGGAGAAIGLIATAVTQTTSTVDNITTEQTAIRQKIHDLGGKWAHSSVDLADATESDGDDSNWQVRQ